MSSRTFGFLTLSLLAATARAQTGAYLAKLGNDTIAIERFQRTGNTIEGSVIRRSPATSVLKYTLVLNGAGDVQSFKTSVVKADGSPIPNTIAGEMTFTADSIIRHATQGTNVVDVRGANAMGTLPVIQGSWLVFQLVIDAQRKHGMAHLIGFGRQQAAPVKQDVRLFGTDSAEVVAGGLRTGFKLDKSGKVVRADGTLTTAKTIVTLIRDVDVVAVATRWETLDSSGKGLGTPSVRDTLRANVGDATIVIDYGRPAMRGREIWGKLVPNDTSWRFGANAATQMKTDKDLVFGGVLVPAGSYTLFLLPTNGKATLMVNSQTGQWGTVYDATKDVAKIPMEWVGSFPTSEDRFRLYFDGDKFTAQWDRGGYRVQVKRP